MCDRNPTVKASGRHTAQESEGGLWPEEPHSFQLVKISRGLKVAAKVCDFGNVPAATLEMCPLHILGNRIPVASWQQDWDCKK